jgi:hypothetical protein
MEEREAKAQGLLKDAEYLNPKRRARDKPQVHYRNLPKKFIAGTVYDPVEKEVIVGASVTLTGGESRYHAETDGFGDFWFEGLKVGRFDLFIESDGKSREFKEISTEKDVNLGDIPL